MSDEQRPPWRDKYGDLQLWAIFVVITGVLLVVGVGLTIGCWQLDRLSCKRTAHVMERDWTHTAWGGGCYVQGDDGKFIPPGQVREADHR